MINYFGLQFKIDEATTTCQTGFDGRLTCKTDRGCEFSLEKLSTGSSKSLGLVRLNRKNAWLKKYPGLNLYEENAIKIMGKALILQEARYFRFDNINWPVLLRSYDVVMDELTVINVTTACDVRLWPANIEIIENIETSIIKLAK